MPVPMNFHAPQDGPAGTLRLRSSENHIPRPSCLGTTGQDLTSRRQSDDGSVAPTENAPLASFHDGGDDGTKVCGTCGTVHPGPRPTVVAPTFPREGGRASRVGQWLTEGTAYIPVCGCLTCLAPTSTTQQTHGARHWYASSTDPGYRHSLLTRASGMAGLVPVRGLRCGPCVRTPGGVTPAPFRARLWKPRLAGSWTARTGPWCTDVSSGVTRRRVTWDGQPTHQVIRVGHRGNSVELPALGHLTCAVKHMTPRRGNPSGGKVDTRAEAHSDHEVSGEPRPVCSCARVSLDDNPHAPQATDRDRNPTALDAAERSSPPTSGPSLSLAPNERRCRSDAYLEALRGKRPFAMRSTNSA